MCHEANQLVSDGGANLWPALHIFQWGKYLKKKQTKKKKDIRLNSASIFLF